MQSGLKTSLSNHKGFAFRRCVSFLKAIITEIVENPITCVALALRTRVLRPCMRCVPGINSAEKLGETASEIGARANWDLSRQTFVIKSILSIDNPQHCVPAASTSFRK